MHSWFSNSVSRTPSRHPPPPPRASRPRSGPFPSSSSASVMLSGGRNRTTSGPAWSTSTPCRRHTSPSSPARPRPFPAQHRAEHQPLAAHLGDEADLVVQRHESLSQPLALTFDVGEQLRRAELAQHHPRHRGRDGIPAEGRAVAPGLKGLGRLFSDQHCANRKAATQRLRDGHDVRGRHRRPTGRRRAARFLPSPLWISSNMSSASCAPAALRDRGEEAVLGRNHAPLALDRFPPAPRRCVLRSRRRAPQRRCSRSTESPPASARSPPGTSAARWRSPSRWCGRGTRRGRSRSRACSLRGGRLACLRASLIAASFASAPELQKNTLSANDASHSSPARRTTGSAK